MYKMGYDSARCHNYDTSKVKRKRTLYIYECQCDINNEHYLTKRRHEQVKNQIKYGGRGLFYCKRWNVLYAYLRYNMSTLYITNQFYSKIKK